MLAARWRVGHIGSSLRPVCRQLVNGLRSAHPSPFVVPAFNSDVADIAYRSTTAVRDRALLWRARGLRQDRDAVRAPFRDCCGELKSAIRCNGEVVRAIVLQDKAASVSRSQI